MIDRQGACQRGSPIRPWLAAGKAALLVGLLLAHFGTRYHAHRTVPLHQQFSHPFVYRVSLSVLAGQGFKTFTLSSCPESRPVAEFLGLQRQRLGPEEFRAFLSCPDVRPLAHPYTDLASPFPVLSGDEHVLSQSHYTTRVLDIYAAALIWRLCGISWAPLALFYVLISTGTCFCAFAIARKLGGGFGPGLREETTPVQTLAAVGARG